MIRTIAFVSAAVAVLAAAASGPARAVAITTADGSGADAYVHSDNTTTNYGSATTLANRAGSFYDELTYLKFDLSGVTDPITAVDLSLTLAGTNPTSLRVYGFWDWSAAGNGWSEGTLTYDNAPGLSGAGLVYLGSFSTAGLSVGDTTAFSSAGLDNLIDDDTDNIVSFLLQAYDPLNTAIQFAAKENTTYAAPTLNLTLDTSNDTVTIPAPTPLAVFGFGLAGLMAVRRRDKET
jgi:hypothetical protein